MSREFYATMDLYHANNAERWRKLPPARRYVKVRCADALYVYLHEIDTDGFDCHIQTQEVEIPARWDDRGWPAEATVRRYIHAQLDLAGSRIVTIDA